MSLATMPRRAYLLVLVAVIACGPAGRVPRRAESSLPAYGGEPAELFDDGIDPAAVGLELGGSKIPPSRDEVFRERAQTADGILRARVKTVGGTAEGPDAAFTLTLEPVERLGGKRAPTVELTFRFERTSRAFGLIRSKGDALAGKTFVVFVREFAGDPAPVWHAHLAADTKEVEAAVKEAAALRELR